MLFSHLAAFFVLLDDLGLEGRFHELGLVGVDPHCCQIQFVDHCVRFGFGRSALKGIDRILKGLRRLGGSSVSCHTRYGILHGLESADQFRYIHRFRGIAGFGAGSALADHFFELGSHFLVQAEGIDVSIRLGDCGDAL